jgi:dipicolinate synthase subunit A
MDSKGFAFIGGDFRQIEMAKTLANEGYEVSVFGMGKEIELNKFVEKSITIKEAVETARFIILPLPCSVNGNTINAPLHEESIYIEDLFNNLEPDYHIVFGGRANKIVLEIAQKHKINFLDYFEREELIIQNAIPTAEGAIQIAMEEMPITIHGSRSLVLGYGRIGKTLAKTLYNLGSDVSVEARKHSDLAWIKSYGYKPVNLDMLSKVIMNYDVIFNTVPKMIIDDKLIKNIRKDCLVIDLASKPGGVDFEMAKEAGIKVIWALSLPGKVAPVTAGNIILDTIFNIIYEREGEKWNLPI